MNTHSSGANNDDNTNKNVAGLADLLTQIVTNLNARRANDAEGSSNARQGCSYKAFMASNLKEFYGTKGAVSLLRKSINLMVYPCLDTWTLNQAPNNNNNNARNPRSPARYGVYVIGAKEEVRNPNVVTGTFLLNGHYVSVLFNSGADKV
uniref:Reverse transcriptase domain-containing protein n=1 Tax=Tanacetum cinerariifolium TaxID=118510 RepID=A0A6L2LT47_TANCI|nr:reverse transcriptase domain-containing protein [Tanacetum cinerariifolium]